MRSFSSAVLQVMVLGMASIVSGSAIAQQNYPTRPIRYIVPYPPGGSTDPMARMISGKLTDRLGQQVIVDNRPGGNTIIGTEVAAKSAPDGYTIPALVTQAVRRLRAEERFH